MREGKKAEAVHVLDISASNIKYAVAGASNNPKASFFIENPISLGEPPSWEMFEDWIASKLGEEAKMLGVATAGFVDSDQGQVVWFRRGGWKKRPIIKNFKTRLPSTKIALLNDSEAHLISALLEPGIKHPVISISIGTAFGFSMTNEDGRLVKPRNNSNFDIGSIKIPTRATKKELWWALGSEGLSELQKSRNGDEGTKHFGYRLGTYLASLTIIFQPRTIVLSGGVIENHWEKIKTPINREFQASSNDFLKDLKGYIDEPRIIKSNHGANAALAGIAYFTAFGFPK